MTYSIPSGIIVPWPGANGSIPASWNRFTALDAKFAKGVATNASDPGTTGGATTHSHTTAGHVHAVNHSHTFTGSTAASAGASAGGSGSNNAVDAHTHSAPAGVASTNVNLGSTSPASGTSSNDPANLEVIWLQSDGTPTGVPNNCLAMFNSDTLPSSWSRYVNGQNNHLKGAAAAGDGGATNAGSVAHTHTIAAHTHTSTAHTHAASGTTGTPSGTNGASGGSAHAGATHTHTASGASASTGAVTSSAGDTTASGNAEPPWYKLNIIQNGTGGDDLPFYTIGGWVNAIAGVPTGWVVCDGTNSTPNLLAKYIKGCNANGEVGTTGGALTHTHAAGSGHTHTAAGHTHSATVSSESAAANGVSTSGGVASNTHTHTALTTDSDSTTSSSVSAGVTNGPNNEPPFQEVAWVQFNATQTFPNPSNSSGFTQAGNSTTHNQTIPQCAVGDLLITFAGTGSSGGPGTWGTTPSGWTSLINRSDGIALRAGIWWKVSDGTESPTGTGTVNFPTTGNSAYAGRCIVIDAATWDGNTSNIVVSAVATNGNPINPPALTTGYQGATLFITCGFASTQDSTIGTPTNYSNQTSDFSVTGTLTPQVGTASRKLNALSDDPSTFSGWTTTTNQSWTVGIKGVVAMPVDPSGISEVNFQARARGVSRGVARGMR